MLNRILVMVNILLLTSFLSSCGIGISSTSIVKPQSGKSIVYGKIVSISDGAYLAFSLYNPKKDSLITLTIRPVALGSENEKIVVFEIDPGEYDLFSYSEGHYETTYTYYWFSKEGFEEIKSLNRRPTYNEYKKMGHDKLIIPAGQVVYIGEWKMNKISPIIMNNKTNNDIEVRKIFKDLDIENSVSSLPKLSFYP